MTTAVPIPHTHTGYACAPSTELAAHLASHHGQSPARFAHATHADLGRYHHMLHTASLPVTVEVRGEERERAAS